ncbi:hypothetical protein HPB51_013213 [Rhipicephalus microplus]|uniref:Uncharacterized protein n=1 Tax=Rhipicephalus microplus TaxID=6941 RepID=A0A9J6DML4_RHIMP|nr:hypothetical protein HPB51_013213 [Rhipicephalus microplus]
MMFSATLSKDVRPVCLKFMQDPMEVYVDDEAKLTLHGLQQYYMKLRENEKNRKLIELLDFLEFNQVVIFVQPFSAAWLSHYSWWNRSSPPLPSTRP